MYCAVQPTHLLGHVLYAKSKQSHTICREMKPLNTPSLPPLDRARGPVQSMRSKQLPAVVLAAA